MAKTQTRSVSKKTGGAGGSSSKRRRISVHDDSSSSSATLGSQSPVHVTPGSSKVLAKPLLKERLVDTDLLAQIGVLQMFQTLGCASLLSPSPLIYPSLVREFYKNFRLMDGDVVYSMVKDTPIVFKADCLARVISMFLLPALVPTQLISRTQSFSLFSTPINSS